jgi:uncharacterized membrane protein HdeD (DUF308 family)
MPWRIKRIWVELILGVLALTIGVVVLVLNRDTSSDLLAVLGVVGGVAIIINALPSNGEEEH